jgi:hypothetical protein
VALIAEEGWKLLPLYRFEPATGLWRHRDGLVEPPLSLADVTYTADGMHYPDRRRHGPEGRLEEHLAEARTILADPPQPGAGPDPLPDVDADFETLRWFWLPGELQGPSR